MKSFLPYFIFASILFLFTCKGNQTVSKTTNIPSGDYTIADLASSVNEFAIDLFKELGKKKENMVFSPVSISSALAIAYAGAKNNTAREMSYTLNFPADQSSLHAAFRDFIDSLTMASQEKGTELKIANGLWVQENYKLLPEFIELGSAYYSARIENVSFKSFEEQEKSRTKINKWVEKQTNNKIQNLIPEGILNELTRLIITNAVYFNGNWTNPFEKNKTSPSIFHVSSSVSVKTDFMHQKEMVWYYEDEEIQAVQLLYKGERNSMIILLPKETDDWRLVSNILTISRLDIIRNGFKREEVEIAIPRYTIECEFGLKEILERLGMKEAFSNDADFSGITGHTDLTIDDVLHKAFIEVNETGTEAAAATAVIMALKSAYEEETIRFTADHPFLYFITDLTTGSIIFMGRLVQPPDNG
ncbi:MAG: serpin family protein [Bacteroidales bacterium]|nr:serpin family protein [Bacteroidales bacterium]